MSVLFSSPLFPQESGGDDGGIVGDMKKERSCSATLL
jgi:hypothetical protein